MKLTVSRIAKILAKTCSTLPAKDHPLAITAVLHIMQKKRLGKEIRKLLPAFTKAWKAEHGILDAKLTTAKKEENHIIETLEKTLEKHFQKKIKLETHVDHTLISGYVLQVEDKRIDASLKTRLNDLALTLTHS